MKDQYERALREAWRRGQLSWKLHGTEEKRGQLKLDEAYANSEGRLFVGDCSRQLGKSTWAVIKCLEKAIQKPGSRIRYGTAFLTDLEQFILPAFDLALEDCPEDLRPEWKAQKSAWYFRTTNSIIKLVGLDRKPNGLRGNRLDLVVLDEAGYITRLNYIYRNVLIPATTHVPDAKIVMISTQPESPDHDFVKFCDKAQVNNSYVKIVINENPLLTEDQIEDIADECGGKNSTAFRREYMCERIVEEERAIIPEFKDLHVVKSPISNAHKYWLRMESLDSGVRDKTACLFGYYDFERAKLCIEDEFTIKGNEVTTPRIAELVREKEKSIGYESVYRRIADNDNLILIQDLGSYHNLHFAPTNKDELHAMVNKVRIWFTGNRIEIHPRCEELIGCIKAGIWDSTKKAFSRSELHGHYDLLSALIYMVRNCPESENPLPPLWGRNLSDDIFTRKEQNKNVSTFKKAFNIK